MFDALTRLFAPQPEAHEAIDTKLAVAALLVHLMRVDGEIEPEEQKAVRGILMGHFDLDQAEVEALIRTATETDAESVDLYKFTSGLTKLDMEQRIEIIRMMWTVVFADAENHELEDNMVWRVAELIGVSSRDRTILRSQMKRGLDQDH